MIKSLEKTLMSQQFCTRLDFTEGDILLCLSPYKQNLLEIFTFLSNMNIFISELNAEEIDKDVAVELNTSFRKIYQPKKTPGDGNCLWHMISISLTGNTSLTYILRVLTTFTIILIKDDLMDKLKYEFVSSRSKFTKKELQIYQTNEYTSILSDARLNKSYGNQFHIISISTFLQRNIYIYGPFSKNVIKCSALQLKDLFDCKDPNLGRHLKYAPLINKTFNKDNLKQSALYGFLNHAHYTSLIPKHEDSMQFVPKNSLFF